MTSVTMFHTGTHACPKPLHHAVRLQDVLPASGVGGKGKRSWGGEWGPDWDECGVGMVLVSRMLLVTLLD